MFNWKTILGVCIVLVAIRKFGAMLPDVVQGFLPVRAD